MEKILTVAVCAYNMEDYITDALESCKIKDMDRLEVLIMNDGSTDRTREICEKYCREYPDIFILVNKRNGGWGSNVNLAVRMARGKYFRILDADDWFETDELQNFVEKLEERQESLITSFYFSDCDGKSVIPKQWSREGKFYLDDIKENPGFCIWRVTFLTDLVKQHHIDLPEKMLYMDTLYIVQLLPYVNNVYDSQNYVYHYRQNREGQSISVFSSSNHYKEAEASFNKQLLFYNAMKNDRNARHVFYRVVLTYESLMAMLLRLNDIKSMNAGKIIRECEEACQRDEPEVYEYAGHRKFIRLIRKFHYKGCSCVNKLYNFYHHFG